MNADRRARISALREQIEDIKVALDTIKVEEQTALANLPPALKVSSPGHKSEDAIDSLKNADLDLYNVISYPRDAAA